MEAQWHKRLRNRSRPKRKADQESDRQTQASTVNWETKHMIDTSHKQQQIREAQLQLQDDYRPQMLVCRDN